jgi:hypothetical protein
MYICPRCTLATDSKSNIKVHLCRKTLCVPIDSEHDISLDEYKSELFKPKTIRFHCDNCKKGFASVVGLNQHKCKTDSSKCLNKYLLERVLTLEKEINKIKDELATPTR